MTKKIETKKADKGKAETKKADKAEVVTSSKGFKKGFVEGVTGWQKELASLRLVVNLFQYISMIGGKVADLNKKVASTEAEVVKAKVQVPKRLAGRLVIAKKAGFTQYEVGTSDYFKALRRLVDLAEAADQEGKKVIALNAKAALEQAKKAGHKVPGRLAKRIVALA